MSLCTNIVYIYVANNSMAQKTEFVYRNIELYKSESLGSGSYGGVCKAKCDGLLCAAKIMHPTLFDLRDPGADSYLQKFQEECHLLSLARHPNIVQYLTTYTDPDTRLPVLLMELCDESLTSFLERSQGTLSYRLQLNICHDVTLALVYLHSNGLIHRDLTGNNVLMIASSRAKITDFGMSKLATVNPRMTALTLCPGNILYMSPEALDDASSYTAKLDVFSFGVLLIQILTGRFPSPLDRFHKIHDPHYDGEVRVLVPDVQRRRAHLELIPDTHSLKPLAYECLEKNETDRPSALQLSERLDKLKATPQYSKGVNDLQNVAVKWEKKETQSQFEYQKCLQQKDAMISKMKETISAQQREIKDLKGNNKLREMTRGHPKATTDALQMCIPTEASREVTHKSPWKEGKNAPELMSRGSAIVHGGIAYFAPYNSCKVFSYKHTEGEEQWSVLPDNPNKSIGLSVIDNLLTSVGGFNNGPTNTLLSLTGQDDTKCWSIVFPSMPTHRTLVACITTERALVVAGGFALPEGYRDGLDGSLDTVEVMDITTKQWTTVCPLPKKLRRFSGTVWGDSIYFAGGITGRNTESKCVFTCKFTDLWKPNTFGSRIGRALSRNDKDKSMNVWKEIGSLPVPFATLASFGSHLVAICDLQHYQYDSSTNTWNVISHLNKRKAEYCFAVNIPPGKLIIVGGYYKNSYSSVEILYEQ